MPELRKDLLHDKWVLIATEQALDAKYFPINRNGTYVPNNNRCPFCEGNEAYTPPEIAAIRDNNSLPNAPGWVIRTVPSKYSAFSLQGELETAEAGVYNSCSGLGKQEVVIGNPAHEIDFHQFSVKRIELVYRMMQQRYRSLAGDRRIKYIQIYKNRGLFAGASQEHSHSQIVALPMIPSYIKRIEKYYQENGRCLLCTIMEKELKEKQRIVYESNHFILVCPYAARFSYETWIIPRIHTEHFGDISDAEIADLAFVVKKFLLAMIDCLNNPSYNIVINTAPVNVPHQEGNHWFMEINPRLIVPNGLEISAGYYSNPVAPELAASILSQRMLDIAVDIEKNENEVV